MFDVGMVLDEASSVLPLGTGMQKDRPKSTLLIPSDSNWRPPRKPCTGISLEVGPAKGDHGSFNTRKNDTVLCIPPSTVST
ncbi:hypothetical protein NC652_017599 [Populus alba x Populus x berolinensis]|nr:hypothetical protein NC652_017573 [Populus alba x Populus x berolinensis]KAJ6924346.1 hypothetical protein NC652_017588 [Populus alba x Populus x berolinensis]KAJ6924354.1 hypothetical protein NC652_017596 [Populus alba x Populus x berolinensis]KAJ6924358.1 hypothetical protein NC652_017599 [Populus alba x Populus x berolinensis]